MKLPRITFASLRSVPLLKWAGYTMFFLVCFVLFAYKTFPYERLADYLTQQARPRGYELEILDLTHSGFTGLRFRNLRVLLPPEEGAPALDVIFDELTVGTSFLSLFSTTKSYDFDAALAGGEAAGEVTWSEESFEIEVEVDSVDLGSIPLLRRYTQVPVGGTLSGEVELSMPKDVGESVGNLDLSILALTLGNGKTKLEIPGWGGLTLDRADAGDLELTALVEDGVARIARARSHGRDLKLDALGKMRLLRPFGRSELNVMLRVKIEDAYKERSEKVATMLELASSGLKSATTPDGAIQYAIAGAIGGRLRPRAAGRRPFEAPK